MHRGAYMQFLSDSDLHQVMLAGSFSSQTALLAWKNVTLPPNCLAGFGWCGWLL